MGRASRFIFILIIISLQYSAIIFAQPLNENSVCGDWYTPEKDCLVRIFKQKENYYGQIIWLKEANEENGQPKKDKNNPNVELQNKTLLGIILLQGFEYDDGDWKNGLIYNPEDGKIYQANMKLQNRDILELRGFVGFSLLGKTSVWSRKN